MEFFWGVMCMDTGLKLKRVLSLTLAAMALLGILGGLGLADELPLGYMPTYGDVNLDGEITSMDSALIINYLNGIEGLSALQMINADVSGDGAVTREDAALISQYLSRLISVFPAQMAIEHEIGFLNESFPENDAILPLGRAYSIVGSVVSSLPLSSVYVRIVDVSSATTEISAAVSFSQSDNVYVYNTKRSSRPIDNDIHFAQLSSGQKRIDVYATTFLTESSLVYTGTFEMREISGREDLVTLDDIAGHVYNENSRQGSRQEQKIVDYLNSLDSTQIGSALVLSAIELLGTDYDTLDCSAFTRRVYSDVTGMSLPRTSVDQARFCINNGLTVSSSALLPGDLVFISDDDCHCGRYHEIHHVSIYLGNVDGTRYFIESSSSLDGVIIRVMWGNQGSHYRIDCYGRPYGV